MHKIINWSEIDQCLVECRKTTIDDLTICAFDKAKNRLNRDLTEEEATILKNHVIDFVNRMLGSKIDNEKF